MDTSSAFFFCSWNFLDSLADMLGSFETATAAVDDAGSGDAPLAATPASSRSGAASCWVASR
jgi:hypothetical protein